MRYLLFVGHDYYPQGGDGDYVGASDTEEGAKALAGAVNKSTFCTKWAQVCSFDGNKLECVWFINQHSEWEKSK